MNSLKNWSIAISILVAVIFTPILISQIIKLPYGNQTIGDESSWVSFFGSYSGAVVGGIVAFGIAFLQINNLRKENLESNRSFLSAATLVRNFDKVKKINRLEKHRVMLTDDVNEMVGLIRTIPYYSLVRFGGGQVIWECEFEITVGNDTDFIETDKIKVWIDFFDKNEEILIPLCSVKLGSIHPYVKDITVTYRTEKNELMKFYQSEKDLERKHFLVLGKKEKLINQIKINNTAWTEK